MLNHWDVEEHVVIPQQDGVVALVLAPVGWLWSHPYLRPWAVWLRVRGRNGWLPRWAVGDCFSRYPDDICPCGAYQLVWKEYRHA